MAEDKGESASFALSTLYLQIEYADSPLAILGVSHDCTEADVRESYRAVALKIHPDKAPSDGLRELHTSLFQKVQAAYHDLLLSHFGQAQDDDSRAPLRLPETEASLHARNVAFREALRSERERALKAKHAADTRHAAKVTSLAAKNDRLAEKREARSKKIERKREKREEKTEKKIQQTMNRRRQRAAKDGDAAPACEVSSNEPGLDWEQKEDRLEAEALRQRSTMAEVESQTLEPKPKRPLQNKPTARTARPMWNDAVDERLVSDAEIHGRWNKKLLSGGRSGTVSLSQKKQKEHSGAARMQKYTMALAEEADHMLKPALTGNRTFSALEEDRVMEAAFVHAEDWSEGRTDRMLELLNAELGRYLLN